MVVKALLEANPIALSWRGQDDLAAFHLAVTSEAGLVIILPVVKLLGTRFLVDDNNYELITVAQ